MHNFWIFHFQDVNATFKGPMVLAMSRQEIVSVGLDTMETPVMKEKSRKVKLKQLFMSKPRKNVYFHYFSFYKNC